MRRTLDLIRANARAFDADHGKGAALREAVAVIAALPLLWAIACGFLLIFGD